MMESGGEKSGQKFEARRLEQERRVNGSRRREQIKQRSVNMKQKRPEVFSPNYRIKQNNMFLGGKIKHITASV